MDLSINSSRLHRLKDIGMILWKYGHRDLLKGTGLEDTFTRDSVTLSQLGDDGDGTINPELAGMAAEIEKLGPTFVRIGQLLSLRPDLLPLPYTEALSQLSNSITPMTREEIDEAFAIESGARIATSFQTFDYVPLSVTVFDQTHNAVLKDGRKVRVKIQRPSVREQAHKDLEELCDVADFFDQRSKTAKNYALAEILDELRKTIYAELDFREEMHNLKVLKENLSGLNHIVVPSPIDDYCNSRVLVVERLEGTRLPEVKQFGLLNAERAALAGEIFHAYLQQFLVDGFVHSDPKPGDFLFTKTGKLALLDADVVTRISHQMQEKILQLLIALNEGRAEHASDLLIHLGRKREGFEEHGFKHMVADLILAHRDVTSDRLEIGKLFLGIDQAAVGFGLGLPSELAVLGNTLISLDAITAFIDKSFDSRSYIHAHLAEILRGHMRRTLTPAHIMQNLIEAIDLVEKMPAKVGKILDSVANNDLKVTVHAIDEAVLISGFQKIANRITTGLVLASLIIGAAMLMNIKTRFTIWGYPGLAIICFIMAAGCGFVLVLEVLIKDRRSLRS